MEETKVRIGEEVLLDIGTHSEWYISSVGYDGESVDITLRRKANRDKDWWWLADPPQTDLEVTRNSLRTDCTGCKFVGLYDTEFPCANCSRKTKDYYSAEQTERRE